MTTTYRLGKTIWTQCEGFPYLFESSEVDGAMKEGELEHMGAVPVNEPEQPKKIEKITRPNSWLSNNEIILKEKINEITDVLNALTERNT